MAAIGAARLTIQIRACSFSIIPMATGSISSEDTDSLSVASRIDILISPAL